MILWLQLFVFAVSLWLGLYIFRKGQHFHAARLAGIALSLYAAIIALQLLWQVSDSAPSELTLRIVWPLWLFASVFWIGAIDHLPLQHQFIDGPKWWRAIILPFSLFLAGLTVGTDLIIDFANQGRGPYYTLYAIIHVLLIVSAFVTVLVEFWYERQRAIGWLIFAAIGLMISAVLVFFPIGEIAPSLLWVGVAFDMLLMGIVMAYLDAFETGTRFLPEMSRSFVQTFGVIALIVGQVIAIALIWQHVPQVAFPALLALTATVIVLFQFGADLQAKLDRVLYPASPELETQREQLRELEASVTKKSISALPTDDFDQFAKIVRRALSDLNNVPRLAASPLLDLPHLSATDSPLEKAQALRDDLHQRIRNLKPSTDITFDHTTAWRHYNVLYYPYVVGLKPHSRRGVPPETEAEYQEVLNWFRTEVPERTLYNWQTTAARVLAQDLWELIA